MMSRHGRIAAYLTFLVVVLVFSAMFGIYKTSIMMHNAVASQAETIERLVEVEVRVLAMKTRAGGRWRPALPHDSTMYGEDPR